MALRIGEDNLIRVGGPPGSRNLGLRDQVTGGSWENTATVTVETVVDRAGATVPGQSFPVTLQYVTASNGEYEGTLLAALCSNLIESRWYVLVCKAVSGGKIKRWNQRHKAVYG